MEKNLLSKILAKFKVDAYSNATTREEIENFLRSKNFQVLEGQKRIIVLERQNGVVYKIAYNESGILDNILETAWGIMLQQDLNAGLITQDFFNRWGISKLVDNDPFIITMKMGTNFWEDSLYLNWYNTIGKQARPNANLTQQFPIYVAENQQLRNDYNTMQEYAAKKGVVSDITWIEPGNHTLDNSVQGLQRLFNVDMGSCIPILSRNGQEVRPTCPICGQPQIYTPFKIGSDLSTASVLMLQGVYGCVNRDCSNHYAKKANKINENPEYTDSVVFSKYIRDNWDLVRIILAQVGFYFAPDIRVGNKSQYYQAFCNTLHYQPTAQELDIMFNNYLAKAVGDVLVRLPELKSIQVIQNNQIMPFIIYIQHVASIAQMYNEPFDGVTRRLAGILYLSYLTQNDTEGTIFDMLMSQDYNVFGNILATKFNIDAQNGNELFNSLFSASN